jgi:hypothetical protein
MGSELIESLQLCADTKPTNYRGAILKHAGWGGGGRIQVRQYTRPPTGEAEYACRNSRTKSPGLPVLFATFLVPTP